jgi:hypothetical protein
MLGNEMPFLTQEMQYCCCCSPKGWYGIVQLHRGVGEVTAYYYHAN